MPERRDDLLGRPRQADSFAQGAEIFAESPEDLMDAFFEILSGVKLSAAVFFAAEFSAPWGLTMPASSELAPQLAPGTSYVAYHLLIDGRYVVEMLWNASG